MLHLSDPSLLCQQALLDGRWQGAADGAADPVFDPASGATVGHVPRLGAADAQRAITAAHAAWPGWRALPARERGAILRRWQQLLIDNLGDLAQLLSTEQGKPLAEAKGEILYGAAYFEWFADEARRVYGDTIPAPSADRRYLVLKQPLGVCAAITPWNFPNAMLARKAAAALAAGCTLVARPASQTPFSALALALLGERAGLPPGVFSVLTGPAEAIAGEFTANPLVRKLSFTGSTAVGQRLYAQCAPTLKRLSLELGGNAPFIVFDDADLDAAVAGALASKYRNSGQTCVCANRFYIQDGIYEAFAGKFAERVAQLRVGPGLAPGSEQGPLIDSAAHAKVSSLLDDALAQGGVLLTGGTPHPLGGTFFTPTVLGEAHAGMRLAREEIFGPVAPLFRFRSEDEVIALANASDYGLAAYFYARDIGRVWRVAEALEYGMVALNTGLLSNEAAPFGGMKHSGLGREGSRYGLDDYLDIKFLCLAGVS